MLFEFAEDLEPRGVGPCPEPPAKRLAVTLRWLAVGGTYASIGDAFGIDKSTVYKCIHLVIDVMFNHRGIRQLIRFPKTLQEVTEVIHDFEHLSGLPQCAGAIDGSQIPINKPSEDDGDVFWCYKHNAPAILLLGIVDATGRFLYVDIGRPGSVGDAGALERSHITNLLQRETLLGPVHARNIVGVSVKPYLVGDAAFALSPSVMKGYPTEASRKEKIWNRKIVLARRVIECAFGRLKGRFRVLLSPAGTRDVEWYSKVIMVACCLHNYCENDALSDRLKEVLQTIEKSYKDYRPPLGTSKCESSAEVIRDHLATYVMAKHDLSSH